MYLRRVALLVAFVAALLIPTQLRASAAPFVAVPAQATTGVLLGNPAGPVVLRADPRNINFQVPARATPDGYDAAVISTFSVNYMAAGTQIWSYYTCQAWPTDAKASFDYATSIWATLVRSSVPIKIDACWTSGLGSGILGSSATQNFVSDFAGAPHTHTWYPVALANALHGSDLDTANADIGIAYSSTFNWYFGTTGTPAAGQYDFSSVVLHEVAHGLGFAGSMQEVGVQGSWGYFNSVATGYPESYDRFAVNGSGDSLINTSLFPNPSTALDSQLKSNNVFFDGPQAKAANGGNRPKLYAPPTWQQGSSYSHLDTIYNGTANALMTYDIAAQEVVHDPGPIAAGVLHDLGWSSVPSASPSVTSFSPTSGTVGTSVTITGTSFTGATAVTVGGTASTSFTVDQDTQITATVPTGATTGPISVTTPGGTGTSASSFTVVKPSITIQDASIAEGNVGTSTVSVGVSLSGPSNATVTVHYATADGTATAGSDYTATSGTLTFAPTETAKSISVAIVGDTVVEPDETFYVNLSSPTNATIGDSQSVVTIGNDDSYPLPTISSFNPTSGTVAASVAITGTGFTAATSVKFNGTASTSFTVDSSTQISAVVPSGATTGRIAVTTPGGTATSATDFTVVTCSALSLSHTGSGDDPTATPTKSIACPTNGQYVEGEGIFLTAHPSAGSTVLAWTGTYDDNSTALTNSLSMPAAPRSVSVTYTTVSLTCYALTMSHEGSGADPTASPTNSPGCSAGQYVAAESIALTAYPNTGCQVSGWTGTNDDTSTSVANSVTMPAAARAASVVYVQSPPTITGFLPPSGPVGTSVAITGINLTGATAVAFHGSAATTYTVDSPTQITATVPAGATTGPISVTTPGGSDDSTDLTPASFTVVGVPPQVNLLPQPVRIVDTRANSGYQGAGQALQGYTSYRRFTLAGQGGIPGNATAVLVNLTAVGYRANGWLSAYPACATLPATSNVNFDTHENAIANFAIVKLGVASAGTGCQGAIDVTGASGTNVIVDAVGYLAGADAGASSIVPAGGTTGTRSGVAPSPAVYVADPHNIAFSVAARSVPGDRLTAQQSTFSVNYLPAGTVFMGYTCAAWPTAARASFDYATGVWGSLVRSSVPIVVDVCWASLGPGILGGSSAHDFWTDFAGAAQPNTWYPSALANALHGSDLDGTSSDIDAVFSSDFSWYFGTSGTPAPGQDDFASVVLHELGHGLGFAGSMTVSGGSGSWGGGTGFPVSYDRFAVNGSGQSLINTSLFPNPSTALGSQLTSNGVYFNGSQAKAANGGSPVKLYAPSTWQQGSSYSHLDESFNGTANALMTYSLSYREVIHDPGPVGLAVLDDVGWSSVSSSVSQLNLLDSPQRIVDTRANSGYQGAGQALQGYTSYRRFTLAGQGGIPGNATAVLVNLTAVGYRANGWLSAYPACATLPATSNVNFDTHENAIANFAIVKLGVASAGTGCQGAIDVTGASGTNVIVDAVGYLVATSNDQIVLLSSPARIVDTRANSGHLGAGQPLLGISSPGSYPLAGQAAVPVDAQGVIANLTAVGYTKDGWVAAYPNGGSVPDSSSLNFDTDENAIANTAVVRLGTGGKVNLVASAPTNAIIDVAAYLR